MGLAKLRFWAKLTAKRAYVGAVRSVHKAGLRIKDNRDRAVRLAVRFGYNPHEFERLSPADDGGPLAAFGASDLLFMLDQTRQKKASVSHLPPICSVIILAYNKIEYTFQCLRSVLGEVDLSTVEIIVVDNASSDETRAVLAHFDGLIRIVRNEENLGFVGGCNSGAAVASGKYLLFLNNDTIVMPGWLDALAETAERDETVGAVGSLFLYPNGVVQEAGSIVWNDGAAHHYGWGGSPDDKRFLFAREVDYCSGASLMVRRDLFERLGGFDERYSPGYYEDADICFGVRSLGYRVLYQPASKLVHFEGASAGTDLSTGMKRFQVINKAAFFEKWRAVLERDHLEKDPKNVEAAAHRSFRPIVLVCDERLPTPDRDAGSLRMMTILEILSKWSRPIFVQTFGALERKLEMPLWKLGIETHAAAELGPILKRGVHTAILSRPAVAEMLTSHVRAAGRDTRIIFDMVDAHFVRLDREMSVTGDPSLGRSAARSKAVEVRCARAADVVWCNSSADAEALERVSPGHEIEIIPTIHVPKPDPAGFSDRSGLLFVGNLDHRPNADGLRSMLKEIWPRIAERIPDIVFTIAGPGTADIGVDGSDRVRAMGFVPDLATLLNGSRVFVAPLRFGAGSKGKVGEAMSAGLPVVTSAVGAEGMGLIHGVNAMIADDPAEFADAVVRLYTDEALWTMIAGNAYEHANRNWTPEVIEPRVKRSVLPETE